MGRNRAVGRATVGPARRRRVPAGIVVVLVLAACGSEPTTVDVTSLGTDATTVSTEVSDGGSDVTEAGPVDLTVDVEDGQVVAESPLDLGGTATPGALVAVEGRAGGALVDATGTWDLVVDLQEGDNDLHVTATLDGRDPAAVDVVVVLDPAVFPTEFSP